jgi:hypothetical protein
MKYLLFTSDRISCWDEEALDRVVVPPDKFFSLKSFTIQAQGYLGHRAFYLFFVVDFGRAPFGIL